MEVPIRLRLTRILVYPLKGAGGCDLLEAEFDEFGIPGDRRWMLTDPDGHFLSQRTHPRLSLLQTHPAPPGASRSGFSFSLSAPGLGEFELSPGPSDVWLDVQVHKDRFPALAGYGEADALFSDFLGEACRLVFIPIDVHRPVDREWAPGHRVGLADGYPLHLTTEESLEDVGRRLSQTTDMLSYRPNLVVAGGEPWEEDEWRLLGIGGSKVGIVKPCARCPVITVDQRTRVRGREPLCSLGAFRKWEGKVFFGQNAVVERAGSFRVGDDVHILERGSRRPPLPA